MAASWLAGARRGCHKFGRGLGRRSLARARAVQKAGLVEAISAPGPFTVFAPTNEAFAKLAKAAPATYAAVLADPALLATVLTYHVVAGDIKSAQAIAVAQQTGTVKALEGEPISLSLKDGKLPLNGSATVVAATSWRRTV